MYLSSLFTLTLLHLPFVLSHPKTISKAVKTSINYYTPIHQFPDLTWIENIATYGTSHLLVSVLTSPSVFLLSTTPSAKINATIEPLHTFISSSGVWGITEVQPSIFYVIASNGSIIPPSIALGTSSIHAIDLSSYSPSSNTGLKVSHVVSVPKAGILNGLATLDRSKGLLLASDSVFGTIWIINIKTGDARIFLDEPEMKPPANPSSQATAFGVNGVHVLRDRMNGDKAHIFFANTGTGTFYRVSIRLSTLEKIGKVEKVASAEGLDDFALDEANDVAYVASGSTNSVLKIGLWDGVVSTVLGGLNDTTLPWPTSVVMGKGSQKDKIFVTNTGGFNTPVGGTYSEGAKVEEIAIGC